MTATDVQVRIVMKERKKGKTQQQAAASANLRSRKTAAKYEGLGKLPSELKTRRIYRTRPDPFAEDWPQVAEMLEQAPELEAKTLFEWLLDEHPGKYQEGQRRTFQRRVSMWKALHRDQTAVLEQIHRPGETMQTDGVWLTELGVTIQGEPLRHLLIHCVLPYSNWEWGRIAQSESLNALQLGIQSALRELGHVPKYHQTDNSTAATHRLGAAQRAETGQRRDYTEGYLQLLQHHGMQPRLTHVSTPEENGDVESSNGGLKRALNQHLLLRGSRDFENLAAYEDFIASVLRRRNQGRRERLAEELAAMRPLKAAPLATRRKLQVRVSRASLIRVLKNHYSVPTSLIGRMVTVYVHEWQIEVCYGQKTVLTIPRLVGEHQASINYRHLVKTLLRKPGGFRDYRYRQALFPQLVFRQAWERLNEWHAPRKADLIYLRLLNLAAQTLESEVARALKVLLAQDERWDECDVERLLHLTPAAIPQVTQGDVSLDVYDRLLEGSAHVHA